MAAASAMLARALDPDFEPPDDAMSERILDAALALAASSGVRHLTMDDVARRARVGRMTVYRRFGTRENLLEALTTREGRRCLAELDDAMAPDAPIVDQVAEGFVTSLRLAREHPLLARLARSEPDSMLESLRADGGGMFAFARAFLAERLRASQRAGVLGAVQVEESAELLVRLAFSFVLIDDTVMPVDDEPRCRALARSLVAPILAAPRSVQPT
jgi:TetR/AcrR family transcriptional regulator, repressor for uid operon